MAGSAMGETVTEPELAAVMDCFPEPMILLDAHYRILAANAAYREGYGDGRALVRRHCYEVSHHIQVPCDQAGETCPLRRSLATGQPQRVLHLHHTSSGEQHVDVETYPVRDPDGEVRHFLEVLHTVHPSSAGGGQLEGRSPLFNRMLELVRRAAPSDSTVLLLGESGTGKELVAREIHALSTRAGGPFVPVECSGLTESLFESELFGHEKGAFTGAYHRKVGLVEAARGGTLFLDEIGDIPPALQVKLLRLLETGTYRPVGSVEAQRADFRLICATHRDVSAMVEAGEFRRDLFYRLNVFPIDLPPLRARGEDLPLLAEALLERLAPGRDIHLHARALACLRQYGFPGNVRELRNLLERATLLADGAVLLPEHFPSVCGGSAEAKGGAAQFERVVPLAELERDYLRWAVGHFQGGNQALARALGISERALYRRLAAIRGGTG